MKPRKRRSAPAMLNEEPPRELDFNRGDERSGRVGDPRQAADVREELPPARERQAGMSGGETGRGEVTADDLAPETLLDEDRSRTPAARERRASLDTILNEAGAADIGLGRGKDEAELAQAEAEQGSDPGRGKEFRKKRRGALRRA